MTRPADSYTTIDLPGASPEAPRLILLHGTGGDEHQFIELGAELLPDARRIGVRGDVSEGGALRYFRRMGEGRYDMADLGRATEKLAGFVSGLNRESGSGASYGLGYSNGANILASVLFKAPDAFERAVLMHPLIPFTPEPQPGLSGKKVLVTAGRHDPIAPAAATETLVTWLEGQGAVVTVAWHEGGHDIRREELLAARDFLAG